MRFIHGASRFRRLVAYSKLNLPLETLISILDMTQDGKYPKTIQTCIHVTTVMCISVNGSIGCVFSPCVSGADAVRMPASTEHAPIEDIFRSRKRAKIPSSRAYVGHGIELKVVC